MDFQLDQQHEMARALFKEFAEKDGAPALEGRQVSVVLVKKGSKLLDKSKLAVKNKKDGSDLS